MGDNTHSSMPSSIDIKNQSSLQSLESLRCSEASINSSYAPSFCHSNSDQIYTNSQRKDENLSPKQDVISANANILTPISATCLSSNVSPSMQSASSTNSLRCSEVSINSFYAPSFCHSNSVDICTSSQNKDILESKQEDYTPISPYCIMGKTSPSHQTSSLLNSLHCSDTSILSSMAPSFCYSD